MSALARQAWQARERPQPRRAAVRLPRMGMASPAPAAPLATGSRALPPTLRGPGLYGALAASLAWHGALVGIILALMPPAPTSEIENGGAPMIMEIAVVDTLSISAAQEGGSFPETRDAETPAITPAAPETPAGRPADAPVPSQESVPIEPLPLLAAPEMAVPAPAPASPEPAKLQPANPEPPRTSEARPAPAPKRREQERPRQVPPHRTPPGEAKGKTGEGEAEATRRARNAAGTGGQAQSAGLASLTSYRGQLVAHLTRYKIYPESAQDRGLTGRNSVTITLTRAGGVASAELAAGSGHSILDTATLAAVRRAQPFPAIPAGGPESFTLTIGLNYELR